MKVILLAPIPPPYGGIGNWTLLISDYAKSKSDIEFVHINIAPRMRNVDGRSLWSRVVVQGFDMLKQKSELVKCIKKDNADVIHMTTSGQLALIRDNLMLQAAKKRGMPTVYHIRFGRVPEIAEKNTFEWKLIKKAMMRASKVIAIDMSTYNAVREYAPDVNVCCVPNPFDMSKLGHIKTGKTCKEIVFVGWVVKTKGIDELTQAWKMLCNEYPDWKLRIIGPCTSEYTEELKGRDLPESIVFEGEKEHDEAMELLSEAAAFVLPSHTEGFPNAVLEAMALGKPIVATSVGAIPQMLDGCGIVIPPKNVEKLTEALKQIMGDETLQKELGQKAKQKLIQEYSVEKVFDLYVSNWTEVSKK